MENQNQATQGGVPEPEQAVAPEQEVAPESGEKKSSLKVIVPIIVAVIVIAVIIWLVV